MATFARLLLVCCAISGGPAFAAPAPPATLPEPVHIAFMPDVHFHDVHARFEGDAFPGVRNPGTGRIATIRTMQAQLTSTRLFNENHFAFLAALDDAVARGARIIVLPGDFSDDGQPVHLRGLVKVLDDYTARHGVTFLATLGNHDPARPFERAGGKPDFLGTDPATGQPGVPRAVYSRGGNDDCNRPWSGQSAQVGDSYCTQDMRMLGHAGVTAMLAPYGFMPQPEYRYYETPYSHYRHADYDYPTALEQAAWEHRQHQVCSSDGRHCATVADASYLVEPVEGLWLVGLDANVYLPTGPGPDDFTGSGNQGYDAMLLHKPHIIGWLTDVVARGKALGKQVVAFSHFPMAEFHDGASDDIAALLGEDTMQLARRPAEVTTRALAATGLRLHVAGHMHFNDLAVRNYDDGTGLFNIQAPSLAAYVPAYTLMTLDGSARVEIETVRVDRVPRFDEFFPLYRAEHARGAGWDIAMLDATDYHDFSRRYITELVRLRLLDEWPCDMRALVRAPLTGADLLVLSQLHTEVTLSALAGTRNHGGLPRALFACLHESDDDGRSKPELALDLAAAEERARTLADAEGLRLADFAHWQALDLATDFVRLANAGDLAFADIPPARAAQYILLARALEHDEPGLLMDAGKVSGSNTPGRLFRARFRPLMAIMHKLANGMPSTHVLLDLENVTVTDLSGSPALFQASGISVQSPDNIPPTPEATDILRPGPPRSRHGAGLDTR